MRTDPVGRPKAARATSAACCCSWSGVLRAGAEQALVWVAGRRAHRPQRARTDRSACDPNRIRARSSRRGPNTTDPVTPSARCRLRSVALATACSQRVPCACRDRLAWLRSTVAAASWLSSSSASLSTVGTGMSAAAVARCLQLTAYCAVFARAPRLHRATSQVLQACLEHRSRPSRATSVDFLRSRSSSPCYAVLRCRAGSGCDKR